MSFTVQFTSKFFVALACAAAAPSLSLAQGAPAATPLAPPPVPQAAEAGGAVDPKEFIVNTLNSDPSAQTHLVDGIHPRGPAQHQASFDGCVLHFDSVEQALMGDDKDKVYTLHLGWTMDLSKIDPAAISTDYEVMTVDKTRYDVVLGGAGGATQVDLQMFDGDKPVERAEPEVTQLRISVGDGPTSSDLAQALAVVAQSCHGG